ncbi:MAG: hypothetical protein Q8K99_13070 [Actinomycetota bacterium]|nr:hypothetical protein [Actinomycetota bacterium]
MGRKNRTRGASPGESRAYAMKAFEFLESSRVDLAEERFNAASRSAIHADVSAADAVLAHAAGKVDIASDHAAAIALMRTCLGEAFPATAQRQIAGLLSMKNEVEYGQRVASEVRARTLVDQSERFVAWANRTIEESSGSGHRR